VASAADQKSAENRRRGRLDDSVAAVISALPLGAAVFDRARDRVLYNAEMARCLLLAREAAAETMSISSFCAVLARDSFENNTAAGVERGLGLILTRSARATERRSFQTWVKGGLRTTFETVARDGLIWVFVKEQLDAEASQRDENRLTAAVENMAQGLAMFDAHRRLVVCNTHYAAMYCVPEELALPGTPQEDIVQDREARALVEERLPADTESPAFSPFGFDSRTDQCFVERVRGRLIRVLEKPLADGGTVSTHVDITGRVEQEREMAARQSALETQNMRLDATVDAIPHGLAMFDADHRLVTCNKAFVDINRIDPDLAVPGAHRDDMVASSLRNGFAPRGMGDRYFAHRARAIEGATSRKSEVELADGRVIVVGHHPTADGGWVSFHQDVTELRAKQELAERRSAELEVHNERFAAAVNNMAHGLAMYDADHRMVVCNEPFVALYALPDHLAVPGARFADIMAHRAETGMVPVDQDTDNYIANIFSLIEANQDRRYTSEMKNGRIIEILHQPMPGGGWVATHQDVTEQRRAEALVAERSAELEKQNMRFVAAVSHMAHGLAMFDVRDRLVICNQAYAELFQLPDTLTQPGTSFWDMTDASAHCGMVSIADPAERRRVIGERLRARTPLRESVTMINGRVIQIQLQPTPDGGWLTTHEDITEEHRSAELIEHMARHDPLTDLPNRASFTEELQRAEARVGRGEKIALLCVDLDNFKEINDTLGHALGDKLLQGVAERINSAKRDHEIAARMGGDEFMLLLGQLDQPHHAAIVAQRLLSTLNEPMQIEGHQITVGASIGIAVGPEDGTDSETLMRNADLALYRAKAEGRGTYHYFEQGMDTQMHERRQLEQGLKSALANEEFTLAFQPLLDLNSNRVSGFEALLRWTHPELGQLSPAQFIPVAEDTGIIVPLGKWVLKKACAAALDWPGQVHVAVNLSPAQFKDRNLAASVRETLEETGLAPGRLELEITETLLLHNAEGNLRTLHELRKLGVGISMDDFGTGYSALNYLRSFPFDKIKIDRSFIADIGEDRDDELVRAVIGLGRSLGIATTAEGVETEEQLDLVRAQGCAEVQGFLFSPPLPAESARELLRVTESRAARLAGFAPGLTQTK